MTKIQLSRLPIPQTFKLSLFCSSNVNLYLYLLFNLLILSKDCVGYYTQNWCGSGPKKTACASCKEYEWRVSRSETNAKSNLETLKEKEKNLRNEKIVLEHKVYFATFFP